MSWYDSNLKYRWPVKVDDSAGTGADVQFTIPADFDLFWDNVKSDGSDVVLCGRDGITLTTFQRSTWTYATKSGVIQADNVGIGTAGNLVLWLYWGDAAHVDEAGTFTHSGSLTGYIAQMAPGEQRLDMIVEPIGAAVPTQSAVKTSAEKTIVWLRADPSLLKRTYESQSSIRYEEIGIITDIRADQVGSEVAGVAIEAGTELVLDEAGDLWIGAQLDAGTTANEYVVRVQATTSHGREIEGRFILYVQDPDETA